MKTIHVIIVLLAAASAAWGAAPPNDNFADRVVIPSIPATVTGTTTDGTMEPDEPPLIRVFSTVWYEFVAPRTGIIRVSVSDYTNTLAGIAYQGTTLTNLGPSLDSFAREEANIAVDQNLTYQIRLYAQQETPAPRREGPFTLHFEYNESPVNDHFTNRIRLTNRAERISYRAVAATLEPDEPSLLYMAPNGTPYTGGGRTAWYQWRAPENGTVRLRGSGAVGVYAGTEEARGELLTNACYDLRFTAVAGQVYHLVFDDCGRPERHRPWEHVWSLSLNGASLLNLNRKTNGTLELRLHGDPAVSYTLEASTNLTDWNDLGTTHPAAAQNDATNYRLRFYRARALE